MNWLHLFSAAAEGELDVEGALKAAGVMLVWGCLLGLVVYAMRQKLPQGSPITAGLSRGVVVVCLLGLGLLLYAGGLALGVDSRAMTFGLMISLPLGIIGVSRWLKIDFSFRSLRQRPPR